MYVQVSGHAPRFADRVAEMLERVEHRPAISQADREAAYRLRYEAYLRQNLLNQRLDAMLYDEVYDKSPNSLISMTYIEGELASTVRVHVVTDEAAVSPALDVFPDVLGPRLREQNTLQKAAPSGPRQPLSLKLRYALAGELVRAVVHFVPRMAFDPEPLDVMPPGGRVELTPKVVVLDRFSGRRPPAVGLPGVEPAHDAAAQILRIGVEAHLACAG
jgi:hypothetical protein